MHSTQRTNWIKKRLLTTCSALLAAGLPHVATAQEAFHDSDDTQLAQRVAWAEGVDEQVTLAGHQASCDRSQGLACDSMAINSAGCSAGASGVGSSCLSYWWMGGDSALRKDYAANGITLQNNVTQFYYGVARGGVDEMFNYAGHGDYLMNVDFQKLGGMQGQFLKMRTEHRFGESLREGTGTILPPNLAADLPTTETNHLYITNLTFMQFLSESFGLFAGKVDTLDGDLNAFASGRGIHQFSNAAFVVTPLGLRTIAYSTLGAGFVVVQDGEPIFTFSALNASDTTRTSGFDELFADGIVLCPELRLPTNFFGLPGHQLFGGTWSSRDYATLDFPPTVILPNVPIPRASDSWSLYWNCDQYLVVDPNDSKRGWGYFARAGFADPNTNPIDWFASAGLGGNSNLFGRAYDTFGIGYYYAGLSDNLSPWLGTVLGGLGAGQGAEIFHNFAVSPRLFITADTQYLVPSRDAIDDSIVVGLRANLKF